MMTLVHLAPDRSTAATAALMADYLEFDRKRRETRPIIQALSGFAVLALVGGALGRMPGVESLEAAGTLIVPVCALLVLNAWRSAGLRRRLSAIRADIQQVNS